MANTIRPGKTKAFLIETPTNPLMRISDLSDCPRWPGGTAWCAIVDNTFNRIGVTDDLLRLSAGIEDAGDLIDDLEQVMA